MTTNFRGALIGEISAQDVTDLVNAKANLIRYEIVDSSNTAGSYGKDQYLSWLNGKLAHLDSVIIPAVQGKARIVLDLHTYPGAPGVTSGDYPNIPVASKTILTEVWKMLANKYKNNDTIYVYGLANEMSGKFKDVWTIQTSLVKTIRAIDPNKRIAVTPPHSNPTHFSSINPLDEKNIWYELHTYYPGAIAMQGIGGNRYPVEYPTTKHNKADLIAFLSDAITFSQKRLPSSCKVFVGEFSSSTFGSAVTRYNLLQDCIKIFEQNSWNWSYHAFREADVWAAEYHLSVWNLLKSYWAKNTEK